MNLSGRSSCYMNQRKALHTSKPEQGRWCSLTPMKVSRSCWPEAGSCACIRLQDLCGQCVILEKPQTELSYCLVYIDSEKFTQLKTPLFFLSSVHFLLMLQCKPTFANRKKTFFLLVSACVKLKRGVLFFFKSRYWGLKYKRSGSVSFRKLSHSFPSGSTLKNGRGKERGIFVPHTKL